MPRRNGSVIAHKAEPAGHFAVFTVYEDRIEILSRGTLAPNQTIDGFFAADSVPVNAKLSEIFLQLHISEKYSHKIKISKNDNSIIK